MAADDDIPIEEARRRQRDEDGAQHYRPPNPNYRVAQLRAVDPLEWEGQPPPERRWVVPDWVPLENVTMLGGDGGVGKSLVGMQLLTAAATGKGWLGYEVMRCKVLGIFAEDGFDELQRRQVAINRHLDITMTDLGDMSLVSRAGADSVMMGFGGDGYESRDRGEPTEFFQRVHNLATEHGAQLVVLDSLHDYFSGNENSRPQARQFVSLLRGLAIDIEGAVVVCAHPSLTGLSTGTGMSGSTGWNNSVRSRLYLTRPADDGDDGNVDRDLRALKVMKSNYSRTGDEISLRWKDGVFVREDQPGGIFATIEKRSAETAFLEALDALTKQGRKTNSSSGQSTFAPKMMVRMPETDGFRQRALEKAMERLFHDGKIILCSEGPPSRARKYIARAPEKQDSDDSLL